MNKFLSLGHISTEVRIDKKISASTNILGLNNINDTEIHSNLTDNISEIIIHEILKMEPGYIDVMSEKNVNTQIKTLCHELCISEYSDVFLPRDLYSKILQYQMSLGTYIHSNSNILQGTLPKYGTNELINLYPINFNTPNYRIVCMMSNSFLYNISFNRSNDVYNRQTHVMEFGYQIDSNRVKVIDYIDKYNPDFIQYNRNKKIEKLLS